MQDRPLKFETLAVHAGAEPDAATGAIAPPIHLSTTFRHAPDGTREAAGFEYVREMNPNEQRLEAALCALEGGGSASVFASGMAAASALLQSLPTGTHVVLPA